MSWVFGYTYPPLRMPNTSGVASIGGNNGDPLACRFIGCKPGQLREGPPNKMAVLRLSGLNPMRIGVRFSSAIA
jgi:hypothetical protein